jgi:hypothetical protein
MYLDGDLARMSIMGIGFRDGRLKLTFSFVAPEFLLAPPNPEEKAPRGWFWATPKKEDQKDQK